MGKARQRWNLLRFRRRDKVLVQALQSAYILWARRHPEWQATLFDEHFLWQYFLPLARAEELPPADQLALAWVAQLTSSGSLEKELATELRPAAADFLYLFGGEYAYFVAEAQRRQQWMAQIKAWVIAQINAITAVTTRSTLLRRSHSSGNFSA